MIHFPEVIPGPCGETGIFTETFVGFDAKAALEHVLGRLERKGDLLVCPTCKRPVERKDIRIKAMRTDCTNCQ